MTVKLHAASGTALAPGSARDVTQRLDFANPSPDKPYMLKLRISYTSAAGTPVVAQATVNDFPRGSAAPALAANLLFG